MKFAQGFMPAPPQIALVPTWPTSIVELMRIRALDRTLAGLVLGCVVTAIGQAWDHQVEGQPIVRRQESADSGFAGAVWTFCAAPNGDVFLGADSVVLLRNSYSYQKLTAAKSYGFRALAADSRNRIWVGAAQEIGFLQADPTGQYVFTSLQAPFSAATGAPPRDILAVQPARDGAIFVSEQAVAVWDGQAFLHYPLLSSVRLQPLRPTPNLLWIYQRNQGVLALDSDGPRLVLANPQLPGPMVWLLAPTRAAPRLDDSANGPRDFQGWLAGTAEGAFVFQDGQWQPLPQLTAALTDAVATTAITLDDHTVAIATRNRGVYIAHRNGQVLSHLDRENALPDNQTHALWQDARGDLWIGTATGWTRVTPPDRLSLFPTAANLRVNDAVRSVARVNGSTYAATSQGVSVVTPGNQPGEAARLVALPPAPGPVWCLAAFQNTLLAGGTGGLWQWTGSEWSKAYVSKGDVLALVSSRRYPGRLYLTDGSKLFGLETTAGSWRSYSLHEDAGDTPVSMLEDAAGDVWISTVLKGVLHYAIDPRVPGSPRLNKVAEFAPGNGLPAESRRPLLAAVRDHIVIVDDSAVLALKADGKAYEPVPALRNYRGISAATIETDGSSLWVVETRDRAARPSALLRVDCTTAGQWTVEPLAAESLSANGRPTPGVLVLQPTSEGPVVWLGAARGLVRLSAQQLGRAPLPSEVRLVSAIATGPRRPYPEIATTRYEEPPVTRLPLDRLVAPLPAQPQILRFEFGAVGAEMAYQTQLAGLEEDWAAPSGTPLREFTGLAAGSYELRVRTIDRFNRTGPVLAYSFRRLAAWYNRWPAWLAYTVLAGLSLWGGYRWRVRQFRRQNERLNHMVAERTRELALANSDKMDFLASISHEIRNPLNGVTGLVNLLNHANLRPRERELAQSLAACAGSLRRVFDEVLGFARLEQGQVQLQERPFRLRALLDDVVRVFTAESAQRGNRVAVRCSGGDPALLGDDQKIRTIVTNFVANALKYAPGAPVEVEASLEPAEGGRMHLSIQVRDHGPGIPPEEQELIFRKFVRGSGAAEQRETGAGLGLATCQALAHLMGGSVGVESALNAAGRPSGATFYLQLTLPLTQAPVTEPIPLSTETLLTPSPSPVPASPTLSGRALVVEDHAYNQLVARSIVERLGFAADVANDAAEADQCLLSTTYNLVLLDWDVPGAKGDELARKVRAAPLGSIPVVLAVTAHDSDEIKRLCLAAGMDGFLVKPLDETVLAQQVREVLERRRHQADSGGDFKIFAYLGKNDPVRSRQAAEEYVVQLDRELEWLEAALAVGDRDATARRAHRLRAHAAVVRCQPLNQAAKQLQEEALAGADLTATAAQLRQSAGRLRADLKAFMAQAN